MPSKKLLSIVFFIIAIVFLVIFSINVRKGINTAPEISNQVVGKSLSSTLNAEKGLESLRERKMSLEGVKNALEGKLPGVKIKDIEQSPVKGFYQVFFSGEVVYVSDDARFIFSGNLLELADNAPINHGQLAVARFEAKQAPVRAKIIGDLNTSDMVIFKAPKEKHVITVFTDVDCAYCRKLHKDIPELNEAGVTIRYLAYPRAGVGSDSYKKLVSIWCSKDKNLAMDEAKLNRKFGNNTCENPLESQYNLTQQFGLSGTPSLILDDGELITGYPQLKDLIGHLRKKMTLN